MEIVDVRYFNFATLTWASIASGVPEFFLDSELLLQVVWQNGGADTVLGYVIGQVVKPDESVVDLNMVTGGVGNPQEVPSGYNGIAEAVALTLDLQGIYEGNFGLLVDLPDATPDISIENAVFSDQWDGSSNPIYDADFPYETISSIPMYTLFVLYVKLVNNGTGQGSQTIRVVARSAITAGSKTRTITLQSGQAAWLPFVYSAAAYGLAVFDIYKGAQSVQSALWGTVSLSVSSD